MYMYVCVFIYIYVYIYVYIYLYISICISIYGTIPDMLVCACICVVGFALVLEGKE